MASEHEFPKTTGDALYASEANGSINDFTVEAGETVAAGQAVFVYMRGHASAGEAWLSDANVQDKNRVDGIVIIGGDDGDDIVIRPNGLYFEAGAFTDKETYYLSATAGALTTTPSGVRIGIANNTGQLMINIVQDDRDTLSTIKQWLPDHANMIANPLTAYWKLCDGTAISDAESPLNGGNAPTLNDGRFLEGQSTSDDGANSTSADPTHTHTVAATNLSYRANPDANRTNYLTDGQTSSASSVTPKNIDVVFIMKIK